MEEKKKSKQYPSKRGRGGERERGNKNHRSLYDKGSRRRGGGGGGGGGGSMWQPPPPSLIQSVLRQQRGAWY